ncbi:MAG: dephospho-CoA kinase [Verrucomicrobiales bacterium]
MPNLIIGLTGGIASGKSTASKFLIRLLDASFFDADTVVHDLLAGNPDVREQVLLRWGRAVLNPEGEICRKILGEKVFRDPEQKKALEQILHPRVMTRCREFIQKIKTAGAQDGQNNTCTYVICDIPLLFEVSAESLFDTTLVVACTRDTQHRRLVARFAQQGRQEYHDSHGSLGDFADLSLATQLPLLEKLQLPHAHLALWNEFSLEQFEEQITLAAQFLINIHGQPFRSPI